MSGLLILDGSYVSIKEVPGDCDCLFIYDDSQGRVDEDPAKMAATDYEWLKSVVGLGDVFIFPLTLTQTFPTLFHTDMFDFHKRSQAPKGVLEVNI